jgi:hypothetical protein
MATIYRKTAKGVQEIETRALKLAPRFRSLLILVDGRRSDDELVRLVATAGDQALAALAEGGFIEAIGMTADPEPAARAPAAPARPAPAPAPPPDGFEQRRREAVRQLFDLVGPMGEAIALKLERAATMDDFRALLVTAAQIVANTRGRQAATDFYQRYGTE